MMIIVTFATEDINLDEVVVEVEVVEGALDLRARVHVDLTQLRECFLAQVLETAAHVRALA